MVDDEEVEEETETLPSKKWSWTDVACYATGFLADLGRAGVEFLDGVQRSFGMHENYRMDQRTMHEQAAREIEALVSGEVTDDIRAKATTGTATVSADQVSNPGQ